MGTEGEKKERDRRRWERDREKRGGRGKKGMR